MGNTCTSEDNLLQDLGYEGGANKKKMIKSEAEGRFNPTRIEVDPAIDHKDPYDYGDEVDINRLATRAGRDMKSGEGILLHLYPHSELGNNNFNGDEPVAPIISAAAMNPYSELVKKRNKELPPSGIGPDPSLASNPTFGPYAYENGNTYTGQFKAGLREGIGEETTPDGDGYTGQWLRDMKHGKGRMLLANGDYYEGDFFENKPQGNGIYIRGFDKDKITYTGEFRNSEQNGYGVETYPGGACYKGDFKRNTKAGTGEFLFPDQTKYKGDFKDNVANGKGKFLYSDGRYYEGEFKDNLKHGKGTYKMSKEVIYTGDFVQGKREGKGTITW